jgi:peptidoglycan/LPS O-acetylase OafA/YrhL
LVDGGAPQQPPKAASGSRNAPLDAVRGLAAVGVFVFHTSNRVGETYGTPYRFLGHLDVGVRVFFVLSGYLIYGPFVRAHLRHGGGLPIGEYIWKRFWRIYPAYWLALGCAVAIGYADVEGVAGVFKHGLLVQNYFEDRGGDGIRESWTLVVEVTLYVLVPVFAVFVRLLGRSIGRARAELLGVGGLLIGGFFCLRPYVDQRGVFDRAGLGRVLEPAILAAAGGMLLAVIDSIEWSSSTRDRLTRVGAPAVRWWLAAAGLFGALVLWLADDFTTPSRTGHDPDWFNYQWGHALIATLLVAPLVLAPNAGGRLRAFLSRRAVVLLGVVSFSFYLWHIRVLTFVLRRGWLDSLPSAIVAGTAGLAAALAIGWIGQRYVEQPAARIAARNPFARFGRSRDVERSPNRGSSVA